MVKKAEKNGLARWLDPVTQAPQAALEPSTYKSPVGRVILSLRESDFNASEDIDTRNMSRYHESEISELSLTV